MPFNWKITQIDTMVRKGTTTYPEVPEGQVAEPIVTPDKTMAVEIHWVLENSDPTLPVGAYGSVGTSVDDPAGLEVTPALTEAQALSWLKARIGQPNVAKMEAFANASSKPRAVKASSPWLRRTT